MTSRRPRRCLALAVLVGAGFLAGCGDVATSTPNTVFIAAGQVPRSEIPKGSGQGGADATATTIPLAKQSPTTALFTAIGVFQSCLQGLGVTFVGAPNPKDPTSPANNPDYLKHLITCATQSNILQALKTAQSAQDNLTPKQVETENRDYLRWRKCMIGRGWGIPKPTPNAKGLLFSFGGTGGGTPNFTPPPGQSIFGSKDLEECASQAQQGGR